MRTSIATSPIAVVALALVVGCATASTPNGASNSAPEVLIDQTGRVYRTTDAASTSSYPISADSTFAATVAAYTALGIEPSAVDASQRVVSRQGLLLRSKFQGERLSSAFDCGNGQFGPRADDGRILADVSSHVSSQVGSNGTQSTVTTTIQASLTPNDGVSRDPIRCVSNGGIEEKLRRETSIRLGVPYQRNR
jgi:hypothetical protein